MIDYRIVLSKNLLDFEKRVNQLKQDGWQTDEIANIEWVGERPYDTYIHVLFKVTNNDQTV